jgi:hypothetical protein
MKITHFRSLLTQLLSLVVLYLCAMPLSNAQQPSAVVPTLIRFSGKLTDVGGKPLTGPVGVTFSLYKDEQGGAPLWMETQNVTPDKNGHCSVMLGSTRSEGLPTDLFASGEARWLGVQAQGQAEQPRVLLLSVPYALKAGDAATVGGLPPSAFVLAAPASGNGAAMASNNVAASAATVAPASSSNVTTTGGTVNALPLWTTTTNIQSSAVSQTGSGATAKIGIGTTTPATTLDVKGTATVRGALALPATAAATKTKGANSQPENLVASSFSSSTSKAVNQTFQWQAEPAANDTATPSGTLNLLYGLGATAPSETGLNLSNKGVFTFAAGQTFPGTGPGTVTSVGLAAPASDFTVSGSPVTGTGTLNFAWTVAPTSADTANAIVKRDGSGNFSAGTVTANNLSATNATISNVLSMPTAVDNAIYATASLGSATTILGSASATSGSAWGVEGTTNSSSSSGYGVIGFAGSSSGNPKGVYGQAINPSGIGVYGQNSSQSGTGSAVSTAGFSSGAWGDGGTGGAIGVLGTADAALAGFFASNSGGYTMWVQNLTPSVSWISGYGPTVGNLSAYCFVDGSGNLDCTGAKNAVVPVDGGKRTVAMSAIEAPQNWFEDAGSAQLVNGAAVVRFDPDFIQTVNTEMDYKVFPVPNGDCKGLYVTNKTATSFEVRELGGGTSSVAFDYRIMALRRKYENVRFADHTHDMDAMKLMQQRAKVGAGKQQSHDPGSKRELVPAKSAQLTAPHLQPVR